MQWHIPSQSHTASLGYIEDVQRVFATDSLETMHTGDVTYKLLTASGCELRNPVILSSCSGCPVRPTVRRSGTEKRLECGGSTHIEAISARLAKRSVTPTATTTNPQINPAVPPFIKGVLIILRTLASDSLWNSDQRNVRQDDFPRGNQGASKGHDGDEPEISLFL